ncbi:MAG: diaminopimelate decarboxylase [Zetaproteobacteria bacterium]|nr:MAG: diaminopimelate decarboxylase [Zetaproteobacteria bacterium]
MNLPPELTDILRNIARDGTVNCYIYQPRIMAERFARVVAAVPPSVELFYAMKANPHPAFLRTAREAGAAGIEIASLGEARRACAAGFRPDALIYTGPGKRPEELAWCVEAGVRTVHVESLVEAHRLQQACVHADRSQEILLRVNANFDIHDAQTTFSGGSRKFGVDEELLPRVIPQLLGLDRLRLRGLHVYAASGVLRVEDLLENCRLVFSMVAELRRRFPRLTLDLIDFGGGFGVDYLDQGRSFDVEAYGRGLAELIARFGLTGCRFVLELGRYLAAESGWFCTEILDIKQSRGKKQVICAGGINHFRRPAALGINHPVAIVRMERPPLFPGQESVRRESVYFGGPLCTGADKLADDLYVEAADVGDIAVFGLAGAYGLTMSNIEFLSHDRPREIVL